MKTSVCSRRHERLSFRRVVHGGMPGLLSLLSPRCAADGRTWLLWPRAKSWEEGFYLAATAPHEVEISSWRNRFKKYQEIAQLFIPTLWARFLFFPMQASHAWLLKALISTNTILQKATATPFTFCRRWAISHTVYVVVFTLFLFIFFKYNFARCYVSGGSTAEGLPRNR